MSSCRFRGCHGPWHTGIHRGDQEAKGTLATLDLQVLSIFVNVGIFKANFTWVPLNLVRFIRILRVNV